MLGSISIASLDDYRWLLGPEAEPWIPTVSQGGTLRGGELVRVVQQLRKSLAAERAHLIVELVELRERAKDKFSAAERMFFTRVGLEQATDERVAAYKAGRFAVGSRIADLCCGIGGDLLALSQRGEAVGVDANEIVTAIAARNAEVVGAANASVQVARAEEIPLAEFNAWHIDPDRRPSGKRTTNVELHEPPLEVLERMLAENSNGAIKLAPAAEVPLAWQESAECEWIGSRGECRQLVVWHGQLARDTGRCAATIVDAPAGPHRIIGRAEEPMDVASRIGRYLYEPHAAVLAARLGGSLAQQHQLAAVQSGVAYLTGDERIDDAALAGFQVLDVLPLDTRRIAAWLAERDVGRVEVKKRGVDVDPLALQRKLQTKGTGTAVVLLIPHAGKNVAVMARRLAATA